MEGIALTFVTCDPFTVRNCRLEHSKDQEAMKIISDRFDWLSGVGMKMVNLQYLLVQSMLESRTKTRTTNAIDQTWLQGSTQTYGS